MTTRTTAGKRFAGALATAVAAMAMLAIAAPGVAGAAPVLDVKSSHYPPSVPLGTTAKYTIVVSNSGDATSSAPITVDFTLPAGLKVATVSTELDPAFKAPLWSCSVAPGSQSASCTGPSFFGPVPTGPGEEACVSFVAQSCRIFVTATTEPGLQPGVLTPSVNACGGGAAACANASDPTQIVPFEFGIADFDGGVFDSLGEPVTQAGSHPDTGSTDFSITTALTPGGEEFGTQALKDAVVRIPPGLIGNPQVLGTCAKNELEKGGANCPLDSQVGVIVVRSAGLGVPAGSPNPVKYPVFNMEPPEGTVALFGFNVQGVTTFVSARLRTGGDYGITAGAINTSTVVTVVGAEFTFWGTPADPSHDAERGQVGGIPCATKPSPTCKNSSPAPQEPFLVMPTSCAGPVETVLDASGWEGGSDSASFLSHDNTLPNPQPLPIDGCNGLDFSPTLKARPTTNVADSPSGLDVDLHIPQDSFDDPHATVEAHLRDTTVRLPPGLVINPSGANGLGACSSAQIDLKGAGPANCPNAAKLGTVEVDTPVLDHPVPGAVYIAKPFDNPFDSLLAIYIALHDPETGIVVKLAGEVKPDPATGRLTTTFEDNPQLPFEDFRLDFFGGAGASLRTPATCGTYQTTSSLTPWSAPDSGPPATPSDTYSIDRGPGGACATSEAGLPHAPAFDAGTVSPIAKAYSPFVVNLRREDGSQQFSSLTLTPPQGLVGKLAGIPACPDSALAAAAAKSGREEEAGPSCPAASYVGSVTAAAGAGPAPYHAPGKAYLTGPYKGAPLSLGIVTPATAGPFDLGTIVVRTALYVDSKTAQITAKSDPIPHILQGIPLDVRSVAIKMDRPDFILNPTSCDPMAVGGQLLSTLGQATPLQSRFQLAECGRLGFKPQMSLALKGGTKRGKYPALTAVLQPRPGDANISSLSVALPHSEFLAQEHIRTVCTRVQFAADQCPAAAIYGTVTVTTPLLDYPLSGPVYLRSSDNPLPDLVPDLRGPAYQPIKLESAGRTDSIKGGIRNSFDFIPDAPFTKLVLQMQGGKKGLLVNSQNICTTINKVTVKYGAHNGLTHAARPVLKAKCPKSAKKSRRGTHRRR
jgi:uncharacterized repeat protein (TIGR01451 family)